MKLLRSQKMASLSEDECNEYDVIFIQGRDRACPFPTTHWKTNCGDAIHRVPFILCLYCQA